MIFPISLKYHRLIFVARNRSLFEIGQMRVLFTLLVFGLGSGHVVADESRVDALAKEGHYEEALQALDQEIPPASRDAQYHAQKGFLLERVQDPSRALAHLWFAHALEPQQAAIASAYQRVESQVLAGRDPSALDPSSAFYQVWADIAPLDSLAGVFALIAFFSGLMWLRRREQETGTLWGVTAWAGFLLSLGSLWSHHSARRHPLCVVAETSVIRSGPGDTYLDLGRVASGTRLRVENRGEKDWVLVRFDSAGDVGWIPAASLLLLPEKSRTSEP